MNNANPCKNCGAQPELVAVAYGKKHNDIRCTKCNQHLDMDNAERQCLRAWNAQNPRKDKA